MSFNYKQNVVQMVLKCADIGHLSVDPVTHKRWAYQLEEEFFRQVQCCTTNAMEPSCSLTHIHADLSGIGLLVVSHDYMYAKQSGLVLSLSS